MHFFIYSCSQGMWLVVLYMIVCACTKDKSSFVIVGMIYCHQIDIIHRDLKSRNGECALIHEPHINILNTSGVYVFIHRTVNTFLFVE